MSLWAQQPGASYVLAGTVVNARTGEPIPRALVELILIPGPPNDGRVATAEPVPVSIFTDAVGAFRIPDLASGNYRLSAKKPQFVEIRDETIEQAFLALDKSREDVRLRLSPLGVIEGKIVDQDGQPIQGVNIIAVTRSIQDGRRVSRFSRSVSSDDRGIYRLWNLAPGKYYIKAAGRASGTALYIGTLGPNASSSEGFSPVYFGGALSIETAQLISVDPGTQAQADLRLAMEPAYNIRGSLTNFVPDKTVTFELFNGDEEVSAGRASLDGSTGRFEIHDVVPGGYTLRATQLGKSRAEMLVSITAGDVNGLVMTLAPGVDLKIVVSGGAPAKPLHSRTPEERELEETREGANCQAWLSSSDLRSTQTYQASPPAEPIIHDVLPGNYRFAVNCQGAYVASVTSARVDLLARLTLRIQGGVPPAPIEISLRDGGGDLDLSIALDYPPARIWALLVPQSSTSSGTQFQQTWKQDGFHAHFANLAPGDYIVYALPTDQVEFRNPEFVRSLTGGTSLKIEGGQQQIIITSLAR